MSGASPLGSLYPMLLEFTSIAAMMGNGVDENSLMVKTFEFVNKGSSLCFHL